MSGGSAETPRHRPIGGSWVRGLGGALGSWALGSWALGVDALLGWPQAAWLVLAGLPLLALLAGFGRSLPGPVREGLALATPLGVSWVLNRRALDFWWLGDDPCHLVQVLDHGLWRPFAQSVGYFLTPLLSFSLGADLELFGLDPRAFYAHQLASFAILLAVAYAFLRSWLEPAFAGLAVALFAASSPALAVAQQQMNRHYLEGLVLVLASFALYRRSLASRRPGTAVLGAGLYFLATAAKEVFVPLVALLPFVAAGGLRSGEPEPGDRKVRWRHALPYGVALVGYCLWRLYMLGWGNSLSAYGALSGQFHGGVLSGRLPRLLGWSEAWQALLALLVLATAVAIVGWRSKVFAAGSAVALAVFALPLVPVAGRLEPRHLLLAALAAAATVAAALRSRPAAAPRALAAALLLALAVHAATAAPIWSKLPASSRDYRAEGAVLLDETRDGLLLTKLPHSHHLECLMRLRRDVLGRRGPGFCGDLCYGSLAFPGETFWQVDEGLVVPVAKRPGAGCNARRPLDVDMRHDRRRGRLSWILGPYEEGAYQALLLSHVDTPGVSTAISIPRRGSMPYRLTEPLRFVLKYRSPAGWQTYSPEQVVEPGGRARSAEAGGDGL